MAKHKVRLGITKETQADLQAAGVKSPLPTIRKVSKNDILICAALTSPLILSDNCVGKCFCGKGIQYRPHARKDVMKLCVSCALLRLNGLH